MKGETERAAWLLLGCSSCAWDEPAAPWALPGLQPCSPAAAAAGREVSRPRCLPRAGGLELCRGREQQKAGQQTLSLLGRGRRKLCFAVNHPSLITAIIGPKNIITSIK